jgi:hypothetical protein
MTRQLKNVTIGLSLSVFAYNLVFANDSLGISKQGKVIFASAIIPGWGQLMANNSAKGEIMLWTDGLIWTLYGGFRWYGVSRENDARLYARKYANANIKINNKKYYQALERYNSAEEYNAAIRREARSLYPDDPEAQLNYIENNGYFGDSSWHWQNETLRFSFLEKRRVAQYAFMRASFCIGAAILNRLISIIDCAFLTTKQERKFSFTVNEKLNGIGVMLKF